MKRLVADFTGFFSALGRLQAIILKSPDLPEVTMFFKLNPDCTGTFGRKTLYGGELTDVPPQIYRLHYEFDRWSPDELLEVNSVFVGTPALEELIKSLFPRPTGITFDNMTTTSTLVFRQANPGRELANYRWFKVIGKGGVDDFGLSDDFQLVVSARIFGTIQPKIENCKAVLFSASPQSAPSQGGGNAN